MAQYADIVGIDAPASAAAGEVVDINVRVKNLHSAPIGMCAVAYLEYGISPLPAVTMPENVANVDAGVTHSFAGYFTMPDSDVTIYAYSYWYGTDGQWHYDDYMTKIVSIGEADEMFSDFAIIGLNKV